MGDAQAAITLHQFRMSHYNEKARWALDYKGVAHERACYLPGPHAKPITRLSGGSQVPVLEAGGEVVSGSAAIIAYLEKRYPEPPLYPADAGERKKALDIERWFDEEVGPAIRRANFLSLVDEAAYLAAMFAPERGAGSRFLYRCVLPLVRPRIRRSMELDVPGAAEAAFDVTWKGLDFVAREAGPDGYLVGDRFTVADLAAAAILAPAVNPPHADIKRPEPMPESMTRWFARWSDHPGTHWVTRIYERHRPRNDKVSYRAA